MVRRAKPTSPRTIALTEAGYRQLPPYWVPLAFYEEVIERAEHYKSHTDWIKENAENPTLRDR